MWERRRRVGQRIGRNINKHGTVRVPGSIRVGVNIKGSEYEGTFDFF
jgi:hypothetical protein